MTDVESPAYVGFEDDPVAERLEGVLAWGIPESSYAQMHSVAVAHAQLVRGVNLPVLRPWTCHGPRNVGGRIIGLAQDPTNALILYAGSAHGGLWRSADAGDTWDQIGGPAFNAPVGALAIHPAKPRSIWVGTGSHLGGQVSGNGIYRFEPAADGSLVPRLLAGAPDPFAPPASATDGRSLRYTAIELDPDDPDCAFVGAQTGLWHCADRPGAAAPVWRRLLPGSAATDPASLPPLFTSGMTDFNQSWPGYITDLRIAPDPRDRERMDVAGRNVVRYLIVFAAVSGFGGAGVPGGVFRGRFDRRADAITWDGLPCNIPAPVVPVPPPAPPPDPHFLRTRLALCRSQPNHVFAVFQDINNRSGPVYRSDDSGDVWTAAGSFAGDNAQAFYSMALEVHPDDPDIVVGGTIDLALSTDRAASFTQILDWQLFNHGDQAQHADQHALLFDGADRRKLWVGNDGGLSIVRDLTQPRVVPGYWRKRSHGILAAQLQTVSTFPATAADVGNRLRFLTVAGLQDGGIWYSLGGPSWFFLCGGDGSGCVIDAADPRRVFAAVQHACRLLVISGGTLPDNVPRSQVLADIAAVQSEFEVVNNIYQLQPPNPGPNGQELAPFIGSMARSPVNASHVLYSWTFDPAPPRQPWNAPVPVAVPAAPLAYRLTPPGLPVPNPLGLVIRRPAGLRPPPGDNIIPAALAPGVPAAGEATTSLAFGPLPTAPPLQVDSWIGTSSGRLYHTADGPVGTAAVPWTVLAGFPPPPLRPHQPGRILVHPTDPRIVAVAASPVPPAAPGLAPLAGVVDVEVTVATAGAIGAAATAINFQFRPGAGPALPVVGPIAATAIIELGTSGLVIHFTSAAVAAGDRWTIHTDNRVDNHGTPANNIEVIARLHGRVLLSYDRGVVWTDVSWARARPAAPARADSDSLPFCPITSLRWDTGPGGAGPLRLFAGTLAGIYVLENLPPPPAAPPPPQPLAGFNPVWRPFNGPPAQSLPLTLVNDIEMIAGSSILRIATFGRGVWDCDLDGAPQRRLFIRQTVVEDGRLYPRVLPPTLLDDPRLPAGQLFMDHAHAFDIRVDTAPFNFFDDIADGVEFDELIGVDDIRPLERQAVYVQIHNSGWDIVHDVTVHLLWATGPAAPLALGAAPPAPVPAGLPNAATFYVPPNFNPPNVWQRVGPPRLIAQVRPGEPKVVRFDWVPPEILDLVNSDVALLALCTSVEDPLPAALPGGVVTMADFLASERRAALRIVPVRVSAAVDLFIRDGVDDDARAGNVAFIGRSPDIIVVQAAPDDPDAAFAQLIDTRPGDFLKGGVPNHIYVRIHNRGLTNAIADVRVWATPLDANQQPNFAFASWIPVTAAPPASGEVGVVSANSTELIPVVWNSPPDPNPTDAGKAYGLIVTLGAIGTADPPPDVPALTSAAEFWSYFGERFGSDNAALRVLRWEP